MGDIFDSRKSQSELILNTFQTVLELYNSAGVVLVAIPGNHDKTDYHSTSSFLRPFLHHPGFSLVEDYYTFPLNDDTIIHLLPFFHDEEYVPRLASIEPFIDESKTNILLTHIGISGSVMNNGMKVEGVAVKSFRKFNKVYVGHYHDYQVLDGGRIVYTGASLQHNFGETIEKKGLFIVDTNYQEEHLYLGTKKYQSIEVDIDKLSLEAVEQLKKVKSESRDELRVILIGSDEKIKAFNKSELKASGIAIQLKPTKIERQEIQNRVEPFTERSLYQEWEEFSKSNQVDAKAGVVYLDKVFKQTQIQANV
jgi:exonuclease SbcD